MRQIGNIDAHLESEAAAFDSQIAERLANGHMPDLATTQPCDWFQNNLWRRPYLVRLLVGRVVEFFAQNLVGQRVLEVGCGPGYVSLELARRGYQVVGLDLSREALRVAERLRDENENTAAFGDLEYVRADFMELDAREVGGEFDAVVFYGALHHFPDPGAVLDKAASLLAPNGRVLAYEPARDWWTEKTASLMTLVRVMAAAAGVWYAPVNTPENLAELNGEVAANLQEVQRAAEAHESDQSPMDNSATGSQMLEALRARFDEVDFAYDTLLFDRTAAGFRFSSDEELERFASFLQMFELRAIELGVIEPGGFIFAGQRVK